jgi:peptidyl-prolyl cis-trans isomerase C
VRLSGTCHRGINTMTTSRLPLFAALARRIAGWSKKLAREPLVLFGVAGAALLLVSGEDPRESRTIDVSADLVDLLALRLAVSAGSSPSREALQEAVDGFIDEEVLFRYATELGLDRGDPLIRRRLVQKARLVLQDGTPMPAPDDETLQAFVTARADDYSQPDRLTLEQVYLPTERSDGGDGCVALLARLEQGADPSELGHAFGLGRRQNDSSKADLTRIFGQAFVDGVWSLPVGQWSGPHLSHFGCHLVRIEKRYPGGLPAFGDLRDRLLQDWQQAEREKANETVLRALRAQYDVRLDRELLDGRT